MKFLSVTSTVAAAVFSATALAQNSTFTPPPKPSGSILTHVIQVGDANGSLKFYPSELTASPGDMVQFHFWPKSHSVAQSTFADPCQPMPAAAGGTKGFWSGMMPVTAQDTVMPVFSIMVNDTNPIWFYCATGSHCQNGMTGVINAPQGRTLAQYQLAAKSVTKTGIPDGVSGGTNSTDGGNSTVPSGTGAPGASSTAKPVNAASGLRVEAKALAALVLGAVGVVWLV